MPTQRLKKFHFAGWCIGRILGTRPARRSLKQKTKKTRSKTTRSKLCLGTQFLEALLRGNTTSRAWERDHLGFDEIHLWIASGYASHSAANTRSANVSGVSSS